MRPRGALQSQQQPWGCVPHPDCAHAHQPSHNHLSMRAAWPPCEHMLLGGPEVQAGQRGAVPASPRPANLCTCHAMTRGAAGSQLAAQYLEEAAQQLERQQQQQNLCRTSPASAYMLHPRHCMQCLQSTQSHLQC